MYLISPPREVTFNWVETLRITLAPRWVAVNDDGNHFFDESGIDEKLISIINEIGIDYKYQCCSPVHGLTMR